MTEPTTIRECWERVKARHERSHPDSDWCKHGCGTSPWPCLDYSDAVAALDLLDNSKIIADVEGIKRIVLEPDPASRRHGPGRICECGHTLGCNCGKCQLCVRPDPAPPTRADMLHDFTDMNRHAGTGICKCPDPWPICKGTNKRPHEDAS